MDTHVFAIYVVLFGVLLSVPVRNLVFRFSVHRLQNRLERELTSGEQFGQRRRAWILALFISLVFSFFFSVSIVGMPNYG